MLFSLPGSRGHAGDGAGQARAHEHLEEGRHDRAALAVRDGLLEAAQELRGRDLLFFF